MRDDYVEIGEAGGDWFAGVFPVGDFGDFFWGVVAEESSKKNFSRSVSFSLMDDMGRSIATIAFQFIDLLELSIFSVVF